MKEIRIENFITIKLLQFKSDVWVYFVDYYNEKYFYIDELEELSTHQNISPSFILKFHKAKAIYDMDIKALKNSVYDLYRQLTFSIPRATEEQDYYFISSTFKVERVTDYNGIRSNSHYNSYNYFLNEEEATKYAKILHEELIKLRREEAMKKEK